MSLKVVGNEKEGGSRRWQIGLRPGRSRFVCLIILLSSLILCIFWSTFVCCVIRLFQIKVSSCIAASVLKTEHYCPRHYIDATMPLASFCITGAETEISKIKDDSKIDRETNLDRRGLSQIGTDWHIPDPPIFSLPTIFNKLYRPPDPHSWHKCM